MTQYASPGVYVKEIPSAVQPIAGVGTSTAAFIGKIAGKILIPTSPVISIKDEEIKNKKEGSDKISQLAKYPVNTSPGTFTVSVGENVDKGAKLTNDEQNRIAYVELSNKPSDGVKITGNYIVLSNKIANELIRVTEEKQTVFNLQKYPLNESAIKASAVRVNGVPKTPADFQFSNDHDNHVAKLEFKANVPQKGDTITVDYEALFPSFEPEKATEVKLCTNFSDFKKYFGDFSTDLGQRQLAHAVYGFFSNGGTRCYVARVSQDTEIDNVLEKFEAIDEISIVAAPGMTDSAVRDKILTHCKIKMEDRFAIFDCQENLDLQAIEKPSDSDYAAFYIPWIQVFDPATKTMYPEGDGSIHVPPSGHIAGIYARVDTQRGVHKAPANESINGALGLKYNISKNQQNGLNPLGINCIRDLNGKKLVWGARTIGDKNGEWTYISTRRLFLFLRDSIDKGLQWTVFEPNDPKLWAKIRRNITAFLTGVWRDGALFGNTPGEAFYVKCDEETNPPDLRELGQVVTEIGVAVTKPAEFVIFKISQWAGPKG